MSNLLPPNSTQIERDVAEVCAEATNLEVLISTIKDPDLCPVSFLPYLAWELSIDVWDDTWYEDIKRNVIKQAIKEYRLRGTVAGVKLALSKAGLGDNQIIEGRNNFTYDGSANYDGFPLYSDADGWAEYKVILQGLLSVDQANIAKDLLDKSAPKRSKLWGFDFTQAIPLYNGEINYDGIYTMGVV